MTLPKDFNKVYLDASVLIQYMVDPDEALSEVMRRVQAGHISAYISTIHYLEVLGGNRQNRTSDRIAEADELLLRFTMVEVGRHITVKARQYRIEYGLPALDAIHLATALDVRADVLFTYDRDDLLALDMVDGVWISKPYEPGQPSLFTSQVGGDVTR